MSGSCTWLLARASVTSIAPRRRTIVPYGRESAAIPGISPRRSRGSDVRTRRGAFGGFGVPPRSIFGARLRTRCPQYGHSVTYGETSEAQFLQTTKRSGSLTYNEDTRAGKL